MTSRITRDNFDPLRVIESLKSGNMTIGETERLLEEACHAFQRNRTILEHARGVVENLREDLGHE